MIACDQSFSEKTAVSNIYSYQCDFILKFSQLAVLNST